MPAAEARGGTLAEGALTAPVLVALARARDVEMPIAAAVDAVIAGRLTLDAAIDALLQRPLKSEAMRTADGALAPQVRTRHLVLAAAGRGRREGDLLERRAQPQAKQNLIAMKVGEQGFFYHSGDGKAVVGIVEVISDYYPDHTDESGRFGMVDVKAVKPLPAAGDPRGDQGRAEAERHGARQQFPPVGAAGDRGRMAVICRMGGFVGAAMAQSFRRG